MAERSIAVRLRAEVTDFNRQIGQAATSLDQVVKAAGRGEKAADTFMGRVAQSAQLQRDAWNTVGTTVTAAGAAVTGLGAAVLATGINYNTLRQTSVAALTTLTGSAREANAQMDRLDTFASSSPFARDVFIRAQQQMLAFGIEARKVIPYLDAIQNAVAAAGGSNQDIAEIAEIFGKISAQSKITAVDLMQFGRHGVDAATLIGSQMGMTGAQIREAITDGALDAQAALDALAAGMSTTYAGAADNVKDTFAGAVDRVRAAWRDISSIIAEPLVSRDGGGIGVAALNALADAMRAFEGLPTPVIQAAGAVGMLTGAAMLGAGGLLLAVPRYIDFRSSLAQLADVAPVAHRRIGTFLGGMRRVAPIALGAATALSAVAIGASQVSKEIAQGSNEIDANLRKIAEGADVFTSMFSGIEMGGFWGGGGPGAEDFRQFVQWLGDDSLWGSVQDGVRNVGNALGALVGIDLRTAFDKQINTLEEYDRHLSTLSSDSLPMAVDAFSALTEAAGGTEEATLTLFENMPEFRDALIGVADEAGLATDDATLLAIALGEIDPNAQAAAEGLDVVGGAAEDAKEEWEDFVEALAGGSMSFVDTLGAWDAVIEKNREAAQAEADRANEGKKANDEHLKSWEDFYDGASVSISDYLDELERQVEAQRDWEANMTILAGRVSEATLQELSRLGDEGAPLVAALVDATPEELARFEEYMAAGSSSAAAEFAAGLIEAIPLIRGAFTSMGDEAIGELAERLRTGQSTLQEEIDSWMFGPPAPVEIPLGMDVGPALYAAEGLRDDLEDWAPPLVPVDADTGPATEAVGILGAAVADLDPEATVYATILPAEEARAALEQAVIDTTPDITVGANTAPGTEQVASLFAHTEQQAPNINVGADTDRASTEVASWSPGSKDIDVGADLSRARDAVASWRPSVQIAMYGQAAMATGGDVSAFAKAVRGYATGGAVSGPGTGTSDSVPAVGPFGVPFRLSNGEHVWTAAEVEAVGGQSAMYALRSLAKTGALRPMVGYRDGGQVASWRRPEFQPVARRAYQPQRPAGGLPQINVTLHGVPMDVANETAKAVGHAVRALVRDTGYAGGLP